MDTATTPAANPLLPTHLPSAVSDPSVPSDLSDLSPDDPLTSEKSALLHAFLTSSRSPLDLAAEFNITLNDLLNFLESPEVVALIQRLSAALQLQARIRALTAAPAAIDSLTLLLSTAKNPAELRRIATQLLRARGPVRAAPVAKGDEPQDRATTDAAERHDLTIDSVNATHAESARDADLHRHGASPSATIGSDVPAAEDGVEPSVYSGPHGAAAISNTLASNEAETTGTPAHAASKPTEPSASSAPPSRPLRTPLPTRRAG
jgi:hypothetical protein